VCGDDPRWTLHPTWIESVMVRSMVSASFHIFSLGNGGNRQEKYLDRGYLKQQQVHTLHGICHSSLIVNKIPGLSHTFQVSGNSCQSKFPKINTEENF